MKIQQILFIVVIVLASCTQPNNAGPEERIARVENGLLTDYSDSASQRMNILDRMQHYNVPGVNIAVINDNQVEWAKGYGVLEAGENEPVTLPVHSSRQPLSVNLLSQQLPCTWSNRTCSI